MSDKHAHIEVPISVYRRTLYALLFLTVMTVGLSGHVTGINFGFFAILLAMGIATVKAAFVLLYFMQLKYDEKTYAVILFTSLFFLLLLFTLSKIDIITRIQETNPL
jgi:cytochrome c oxidase subunit 4